MDKKILALAITFMIVVFLTFTSLASAFSFADFFKNLGTGKATEIAKSNCTDSDSGKDYYSAGNVTTCNMRGCRTYLDSCTGNSESIVERYCSRNIMSTEVFKCPDGCANNACAGVQNQTNQISVIESNVSDATGSQTENATLICADTDNGINIRVKGIISGRDEIREYILPDACASRKMISEYYCSDSRPAVKNLNCPLFKTCKNGACA